MIAIVAIAVLLALLWTLLYVTRGSLLAGCVGYLLIAAVFGAAFWKLDVRPIPLTLDRLILIPLAGAFIVQRFLGRTADRPLAGVDLLLFALLGWIGFSTFTHDFRGGMPGAVPPLWRLVAGYLVPAGIYWVARQAPSDKRRITWVQGSLAVFAVYLAVTGILEVKQQWWGVFPRYIADPNLGMHFGRARGPMLTSVSLGFYVAVGLMCCLALRPARQRLWACSVLLVVPLFLAGIYVSYTRSVWLGAALGLPIMLGLTLRGRARHLVVLGLVAGMLLGGTLMLDKIIGFKREHSAADTKHSAVMRAMFVHVSWKMFQDSPLTGCGFGHFPTAKKPYLFDRSTEMPLESLRTLVHHNTLLSLLTETGFVGMALFIGLLIGWARIAWGMCTSALSPPWVRRQAALLLACLGIYLSQLLFHELSYSPLDNALIFFLAGLTVGLRPHVVRADAPSLRPSAAVQAAEKLGLSPAATLATSST